MTTDACPQEIVRDGPRRVFQIRLPMRIQSSKKKKTALNLNVYRNLHFRSLSAQKNNFYKIVKKLLQGMPLLGRIKLHYAICPQAKRRLDIVNVGSIVDKYFSDSLTECGIIVDDDYTHLNFVSFGFGGFAKEEHVLVTITETEPRKEKPMRILLDQNDIQTALNTYVETLGISGSSGVTLTVVDGEITAEVSMQSDPPMPATATKPTAKPRNKGGRPAGSKNKPKETKTDVETPDEGSPDSGDTGDTEHSETEAPVSVSTDEPKSKAAGNSKNLFEGSPEESSEGDDETPAENPAESGDTAKPPAVKKSSIFDQ